MNVNECCFWPKADIETESKWVFLNVRFGGESGHHSVSFSLIKEDFTKFRGVCEPERSRIGQPPNWRDLRSPIHESRRAKSLGDRDDNRAECLATGCSARCFDDSIASG